MQTFKEFLQEKYGTSGTYAGCKFAGSSEFLIKQFMDANRIPNPIPASKLHVTLLYSRKPMIGFTPAGDLPHPIKVAVEGYDVWDTQNGKKALVARLHAPVLVSRHKELMDRFKGTFDYDEYRPHFTMSYDVGPDFDKERLPEFTEPLFLKTEYGQDLDTDWKADDKAD